MPGIINPTNLSLYSNPTSITTPRTSRWNTQFLLEEDLNMISHPVSSNNPGIVLLEDGTFVRKSLCHSISDILVPPFLSLDRYYESATTADNADDLERQHQQQCIISSRDHHLISSSMDHHHHHSHHHASHHTQEDTGEHGGVKKSEVI